MNGFQLTFITLQNRTHQGVPLAQWLLYESKRMGIKGATVITAAEGIGHHHRLYSAHFFELADQPVEVMMAVTAEESDALFAMLQQKAVSVFYIKQPIEFGWLGDAP